MADNTNVLDASLPRGVFEALKRAAKERKALVDEASEALAAITVGRRSHGARCAAAAGTGCHPPPLPPRPRRQHAHAQWRQQGRAARSPLPRLASVVWGPPSRTRARLLQAAGNHTPAEQAQQLDQLLTQLEGIKAKLADVSTSEHDEAARCHARLQHLAAIGTPAKGQSAIAWNKSRWGGGGGVPSIGSGPRHDTGKAAGLAGCGKRPQVADT